MVVSDSRATVLIAQRYVDSCRSASPFGRTFRTAVAGGWPRCTPDAPDKGEWPGADPAAALGRQGPRRCRPGPGPQGPGLPRARPDPQGRPQGADEGLEVQGRDGARRPRPVPEPGR